MSPVGNGRKAVYGVGAAVVLAAWVYLQWRLSRIVVSGNADDANTLLAGLDQWRGHVLLHGWILPADSFITGDVPIAAMLAGLFGLGPWLLQAVPLVLATVTLLLGLWLSVRGARTRWLAALPVALAVGLPGVLGTNFWLQSPMHVATVAYCLAAFALLTGTPSRRRTAAGALCLVLAGLGDATAFAIGTVPVAALGLRLLVVRTRRRAGLGLLLVAAVTTGLTEALLGLRRPIGAFHQAPSVPIVPAHQWLANAGHGVARVFQLTGAFSGVPGAAGTAEHAVRLVMTAALLGAAVVGLLALVRPRMTPPAELAGADGVRADRRRELLALLGVSGLASYGVFCVLSPAGAPQATTRYLLPLLITGAVALGVLAGSVSLRGSGGLVTAAAAGAAVLSAGYVAMPIRTATGPLPQWSAAGATQWLATHNLRFGVGTYWDASYLTLESGGAVVVRPVSAREGRLMPWHYFADDQWFSDPRLEHPDFLVYETHSPWGGVDPATAAATYGPPSRSVPIGPYTILVWHSG